MKRASAMTYTGKHIILADKTGDICSFPFPLDEKQQSKVNNITLPTDKTPLTKSPDERFMGTFLLGHSSSVGTLCLSSRFLVSADRDEHIRFSMYPETYIIHAMGFGHTSFVSCVLPVDDGGLSR